MSKLPTVVKSYCFNYNVYSRYVGKTKRFDDDYEMSDELHRVTVINRDTQKSIAFDFWGSEEHPRIDSKQMLLTAVAYFLDDCMSGGLKYDDFCETLVYKKDSTSKSIYSKCKHSRADFAYLNEMKECSEDELDSSIEELFFDMHNEYDLADML